MAQVPFHLCPWNSSMVLAFSNHLSFGCHSGNLLVSNKKSSALSWWPHSQPWTIHSGPGCNVPIVQAYIGCWSLDGIGWSQPHLNTKSHWVEEVISRKMFTGFRAECMMNSQKSSVATSVWSPNQRERGGGGGEEEEVLFFKHPIPWSWFLICLSTGHCEPEAIPNLPSLIFIYEGFLLKVKSLPRVRD